MAPSTHTNNYTLGRGEIWFARFATGYTPGGFRYIGNTPEVNLTIESETLDHYSSDAGIREKDDSVPLEVNRTGSLVTDNIDPENVALFFFGSASTVATAAALNQSYALTGIEVNRAYLIGATTNNPTGVFGIDEAGVNNSVEISGGATLVEGTDYTIDYNNGMITFLSGGSLTGGEDIDITYDLAANSRSRVISGSEPVEGAMIYRTINPKGEDCTFYFPYVKVSPNGDYALKGDEWQQIPMSLEVLKLSNAEAIYRDGDPVFS
jgi:hypothetical protein